MWRLFSLPLIAFAQTPSLFPEGGVEGCDFQTGNIEASCVWKFIANAISTIFGFVGGIFLLLILFGGYQYIISSATGDKEGGKARIKFAVAGFIASALSFFIIDFVISSLAGI
ncbi:MAG: hypothetical protein PHI23_02590 [Candidatus Peribacteraceae bacterium]|nr:hypothetical protein [Candidatus Peribacteraceae bacterium]